MYKAKNDNYQSDYQHHRMNWAHRQPGGGVWVLVGIAVLVAVLSSGGVGGFIGSVFGGIGGLIGGIFGLIGTIIGLVFGLIGTIIGVVFGIVGGVIGLVFGLLGLLVPVILIAAGVKLLMSMSDSNSMGEARKKKNDEDYI